MQSLLSTSYFPVGKRQDFDGLKFEQVGTVIEPASEYYSSRLTKKERKTTITDELLSDRKLGLYR